MPTVDEAVLADHRAAVHRVVEEMQLRLCSRFDLQDLATIGLYSPFHFHRIFREVTGTTPARFLTGLRMQHAKRLLACTTLTVIDISTEVGYESLGTFTTQFTRLVGLSPGRLRRLVDTVGSTLTLRDVTLPAAPRGSAWLGDHDGTEPAQARFTVAGLFQADLPAGPPHSFAAFRDQAVGAISALPQAGDYSAFAMSLPDNTPLVSLALGAAPDVRVGRAHFRLDPRIRPPRDLPVTMRRPTECDPPVVSAAAASYLADML